MSWMDYAVTRCHVPEERNPQPHRCENLKTCVFSVDGIFNTVTSCSDMPPFP